MHSEVVQHWAGAVTLKPIYQTLSLGNQFDRYSVSVISNQLCAEDSSIALHPCCSTAAYLRSPHQTCPNYEDVLFRDTTMPLDAANT
jgi:hypothetical protein